jgi:hypothetical protein
LPNGATALDDPNARPSRIAAPPLWCAPMKDLARARLRSTALVAVRPVIRFFDVRFQYLEDRFPALERRVAADVESTAEFFALVSRSLTDIERRLEAIERRLDGGDPGAQRHTGA